MKYIMKIVNGRIGPVQIFCLFFILCVFCVSATHFIRNESHSAFGFSAGTIREGAVNKGGCEPKDIIALGDRLSSDSIISGIEENKKLTEAIDKMYVDRNVGNAKPPPVYKNWDTFQQFVIMAKGAAAMRSKPDEQMIRKIIAEKAVKKEIDCVAFQLLSTEIETVAGVSAEQKNAIKRYTNEMVNMGHCLGWCK